MKANLEADTPMLHRAEWLDLQDIEHIPLDPAGCVDRTGRIEETQDGGNKHDFFP